MSSRAVRARRVTGILTDVANAELESCDGTTGTTRYLSQVGELERIEDPINASDMLKCIEQSHGSLSRFVLMKNWCVV